MFVLLFSTDWGAPTPVELSLVKLGQRVTTLDGKKTLRIAIIEKIIDAIIESNEKHNNRNNRRIEAAIIEIESNRDIPSMGQL